MTVPNEQLSAPTLFSTYELYKKALEIFTIVLSWKNQSRKILNFLGANLSDHTRKPFKNVWEPISLLAF